MTAVTTGRFLYITTEAANNTEWMLVLMAISQWDWHLLSVSAFYQKEFLSSKSKPLNV
jgi:hypothetical protein